MTDSTEDDPGFVDRVKRFVAWAMQTKPARVAQSYGRQRAPILASGLAYQALFAVFAALWATFSIAGAVISGNLGLRTAALDVIREYIPGLLQDGEGNGAVDPDVLLNAGASGWSWSGAVSLAVLVFLALNWLSSARDAIREVFDLPPSTVNFALLKLRDLAFGIGFGAVILVTAALSVASTSATGFVLELVGLDRDSSVGTVAGRIATLLVMFALDAAVFAALYRVLAGVRLPWRHLRTGALIAATGLGVLKVVGSSLLGGASNNPLIASFAVIAGLLIFFNLICQVVLAAATWMAVGVRDDGIVLDEAVFEARLTAARELVAANAAAEETDERGFFARLFRHRHGGDRVGGR